MDRGERGRMRESRGSQVGMKGEGREIQGDGQGVRAREWEQGQGGGQGMSISSLLVFPYYLN